MKKYSFLTLLLFLTIAIILASCFNRHKETKTNDPLYGKVQKPSEENSTLSTTVSLPTENAINSATNAKSTSEKKLPKHWPWRGVSMPSAWSDYKDVAYLHSIGVNFIRIQIKSPKRASREKSDPTKAFFDELEWIDKVLDECKKYDITSIIAFNYLVLDPKNKVSDKSSEFWSNKMYMDSVNNMIDHIANRYKDRGEELSGYEIIGEPAISESDGMDKKAKTPEGIEAFYKSALKIIRKVDKERYFLVTPGPWGHFSNYNNFEGYNINDSKLIYGAHYYLPHKFTHQGIRGLKRPVEYPGFIDGKYWDKSAIEESMQVVKEFEKRTGALIYIGEFQSVRWAPGANEWVKDVVGAIEKNGWAWSYFAYQPDFEFWNPFMEVKNMQDPKEKWELKKTGHDAEIWQYMIKNYFSKNKKAK